MSNCQELFSQVEKITSLILGLSSRLAKTENNLVNLKGGTWTEEEQVSTMIRNSRST